jgi:hypothetical protein
LTFVRTNALYINFIKSVKMVVWGESCILAEERPDFRPFRFVPRFAGFLAMGKGSSLESFPASQLSSPHPKYVDFEPTSRFAKAIGATTPGRPYKGTSDHRKGKKSMGLAFQRLNPIGSLGMLR